MYPNGTRLAYGFMPTHRLSGAQTGLTDVPNQVNLGAKLASRIGLFLPTSGQPDGYDRVPLMPRVAGGMAGAGAFDLSASASLLQGAPLEGAAEIDFSTDANLALVVSLEGDGSISVTTAMGLSLSISMAGNGTVTMTSSLGLSMIIPLEGNASATVSGDANLKGLLTLETGTESNVLTAEQVAQAVWAALAASNDLPGTMGELLSTAGSGGLSPTQVTMLTELWRMRGLDPAAPVTVTTTQEEAGSIVLDISGDGISTSTLTRQP